MTSKIATHAPTSRARVILRSHLCPMYQKSFPTRQLRCKQHTAVHSKAFLQKAVKHHTWACLCLFTDKLEVVLGGVCRCRDGGSSQSGRQRSSCNLKFQAVTCSYNPLGTAATTHTRPPVGLLTGRDGKSHQIESKGLNYVDPTDICLHASCNNQMCHN